MAIVVERGVTESIDDLVREAEALKSRLEEERAKFNDMELTTVAEKLDPLPPFGTKSRRILKGHQGKVLALDFPLTISIDNMNLNLHMS
ncbi:unnamed protein product [Rotaria sordida]|uniref:Uncharacterized protein n=1 Tax=Rotaria sordida TaxID=392033 RepID=A0A820NFQ1_9BILA|nr:unnamed protein product [Rotaria sordida]